jgi:hypothetical protein
MFFLSTLLGLAFAQEPQEDELVVSSKGRLIILRPDNTWEEVPSEKSACHARIEKGQTEADGYTFRARGDVFLTKGKAFSYVITSHPDKSEDVIVQLFHKKGSFKESFNILFDDNHFFRSLAFDLIKVPYRGWSFRFKKDINSPLITDLRTKHIKSFENHKYKQFILADFSAKDFRSRMQCVYDSVYTYLNSPESFDNKKLLEEKTKQAEPPATTEPEKKSEPNKKEEVTQPTPTKSKPL